ncbi:MULTISPECIES: GNAT family N-acetyltransferase [unclassified Fusibacter]|uniref:GNAT family N-acetyltransferase n=1 Tax=unclassified Fusibacter TaxID=2624464 RepID=UPI0010122F95|nr:MULTISPECIES: GNAT family N-acetyltransferase [unclassified Fusibacter]MCK8059084.1 GNAT family N-acetyltransferase [Fusibacter sp. A2]NPE22493.1 GNAT family N-acetyltransferase [Fusibacter sp. A1]RXV60597.1 GNAT family N-acetyltransferase [Fusibacter sp. A1]
MDFKIARDEDAYKIYDFCKEMIRTDARMSFTDGTSLSVIENWLLDEAVTLYIAVEDDMVAAMFRAKRGSGNKSHSAYIACAVHPTFRRRELASKLTLFGLEDQKRKGVVIARTYIYSWNKPSIKTIEKCGFELAGRVSMHEYEKTLNAYIDDLIYHKVL